MPLGDVPLEGSQGRVTFARKIPKRDMPCIPSDKKSRGTGCAERVRALVRPFRLRRCGLNGSECVGGRNLLRLSVRGRWRFMRVWLEWKKRLQLKKKARCPKKHHASQFKQNYVNIHFSRNTSRKFLRRYP